MDEEIKESATPFDMSKYLAETKKEALTVLFPSPEELASRISLISRLSGKAPEITKMYKASFLFELRRAIIENRPMNLESLEPTAWMLIHAPSLLGKGRAEAVEIAKAAPSVEGKRSWMDRLTGR